MRLCKMMFVACCWFLCVTHIQAVDTNQMMKDRYSIEDDWVEKSIIVTFYTDLVAENGPWGAVDAQGNQLVYTTIAVPRTIPLDTLWEIEGFEGTFVARDRGSVKHIVELDDGTIRIDMFIPRYQGEEDDTYHKRVNDLGKVHTQGRYKEE